MCWHCESDHEIIDRQELGLLPLQPLLAFVVLTAWAAAVIARMGQVHLMVAAIAF